MGDFDKIEVVRMATREISPVLQKVRAILLGRTHMNNHRFEALLANRTQPDPEVPGGPAHKIESNFYHKRDARREVHPPLVLAGQGKALPSGQEEGGEAGDARVKSKVPGAVYNYANWD